jgi:hypothetical protein
MKVYEIDTIRNLAIKAESSNMLDAFKLMLIANSYRPDGAFIKHKLELYRKKIFENGVICSSRADGLTEKINSMLNGLLIADLLGLEFIFVWKSHGGIKLKEGHSVPSDMDQLYSSDLIKKHFIKESEFNFPAEYWLPIKEKMKKLTLKCIGELENDGNQFWLSPLRLTQNKHFFTQAQIQNVFFNRLFTKTINNRLCDAKKFVIPSNNVAIHLRGGDVVYGDYRHSGIHARDKSLTLLICEHLTKHFMNEGRNVIFFGASQGDIDYLTNKYSNASSMKTMGFTLDSATESMLCEIYFMSQCSLLIGAKGSGVTHLASNVGNVKFVPIDKFIARKHQVQIYKERIRIDNLKDYSALQRAFSLYNAYILSYEFEPFTVLDYYLDECVYSDPTNQLYVLTSYLNALKYNVKNKFHLLEKQFNEKNISIDMMLAAVKNNPNINDLTASVDFLKVSALKSAY